VQKQNDSLVESIAIDAARMLMRVFRMRQSNGMIASAEFDVGPLKSIV